MRVDWFLDHVASGHAFFTGLLLVAVSVFLRVVRPNASWRLTAGLLAAGGVLIAISATPLPWFAWLGGIIVLATWLAAERRATQNTQRRLFASRVAVAVVIVIALVWELPFHRMPQLEPQRHPQLAVIGDSVTAGIGENEATTWPRLIAERHSIVVNDQSRMGATVRSARQQASRLTTSDTIVILEIGGNDLLGDTSPADFATELDALLKQVSQPGRTVVMFELPLPPGFNVYGSIQRRMARRHGVVLVPKRVLMGILTSPGGTLDTIHLSQSGHDQFANAVWSIIGPAFGDGG